MPLALSRRTESELAGRMSEKLVPALAISLVTGNTFAGDAKEFSSAALPEVNWMSVAFGATESDAGNIESCRHSRVCKDLPL